MRGFGGSGFVRGALAAAIVLAAASGCVKRVHEAPGLDRGAPLAVGSDMRLEQFVVGGYEVRSYRFPLTGANQRRYQFLVLSQGVQQGSFMVDRLDHDHWVLLEQRADGITLTHRSWSQEPPYDEVRRLVTTLLTGGV